MEIYDLQEVQQRKDYKSGELTLTMLNMLNSYGLTDYRISKIMGVYQNYISRWRKYKSPAGAVPSWRNYLSLQILFKIVLSDKKQHGEADKERVLKKYQASIAKELHAMRSHISTSGGSSHSSDKLSTLT